MAAEWYAGCRICCSPPCAWPVTSREPTVGTSPTALSLSPMAHHSLGTLPGQGLRGSRVHAHARMSPAGMLCDKGRGDQATDQAPDTCRPNAAQSVVPGGLRAHTRETAAPFPWGGCRTVPEVEPVLRLAPKSVPPGGFSSV